MRHPGPKKAFRHRAGRLTVILLLLLMPGLTVVAGEPEVPQTVLDQIQRECLRAYPPEMLAEMASGSEDIPQPVEEDPKAQMQFLDKEIPRDKGLFYPSLLDELVPAFAAYLGPDVRFLDLGSGDGRVVFLAAALGADATGIEYDEELVKVSERALAALDGTIDGERVEILQGDFFEVSWSPYDVIFYFDLSSFLQDRVRDKLLKDLAPEAVLLVGHEQAPFPGLELVRTFPETRRPVVKVYRQPDR